uniref:ATP-dependent RNA helicase n=3 Tax=Nicotiana TaxID=4085 RepID=A0A1S3ZUU9_TOBAC
FLFSITIFFFIQSLHYSFTFHRSMGGGPRTFPGGLNKWQWKRLHEKKARDKEKRLLDQEKQLYQARIRSQIRSKLTTSDEQSYSSHEQQQPNYGPVSPQDHIKSLADRFMKEGAEDLWNQDDGPINTPQPNQHRPVIREPIDLRKLIPQNCSFQKTRHFCTNVRNDVAENWRTEIPKFSNSWSRQNNFLMFGWRMFNNNENRNVNNLNSLLNFRSYSVDTRKGNRPRRLGFTRNENSSDEDTEEDEDEDEEEGLSRGSAKMMSSAALGKYDMKTKKRVPLKFVENEDDLSLHVEAIRKEVKERSKQESESEEQGEKESILSSKRFDECDVSPLTVKALTAAGYVQMTKVQEATLSACLEGMDALVKARTGTGKSAAFLLPAIETVLKASNSKNAQRVPPIDVLILCPTRELASQIAAEANVLLKYHESIGVQTLVGGTRFKEDQKRLESNPCQIIVATPGRLLDHIENKSGFSTRLMGLKMLILDEADHLLDLGFRKDIEKLVDCLPRKRQSLLFSATVPKEVRRVSQLVLKREHGYVDTVGLGLETNPKVKQFYLVAPHEHHFQLVHHLLTSHISEVPDYKVIVFCTTAMMTSLMFSLFREMKMNVREIHSRKPQLYRTRISDEFKETKRVILITSDVSARGMNYPDVTLVIQIGIPVDREQYIHRLGRTGREGKEGEGILLLAPWEQYFLDDIKDLPMENWLLPHLDPRAKVKIEEAMGKMDASVKEAAYHAWLGYYNSVREIGRDKTTLVELANQFSESIGLQKPPSLFRRTALKMGLKDIPGIRIRK